MSLLQSISSVNLYIRQKRSNFTTDLRVAYAALIFYFILFDICTLHDVACLV